MEAQYYVYILTNTHNNVLYVGSTGDLKVEPLIAHVKEFGLRRSKMKSDQATLSQGYRSVMGFNLHQMTRNLEKAA